MVVPKVEPKMPYQVRPTDCAGPIYHPTSADKVKAQILIFSVELFIWN